MNIKVLVVIAAMGVGLSAHAEFPQRAEANKILGAYLETNAGKDAGTINGSVGVKEQSRICGYCHGEDGNSRHSEIPSLAGQNPRYIVEQLLMFKKKLRRYPNVMHTYAKQMTPNTMATIALHFAALPRRVPGGVDTAKAAGGEELYKSLCANCHGMDGKGTNDAYSAIQAQWPDYIALSLKRFRDGSSGRHSHEMQVAARGLTDLEIDSLAHYVAGL